MESKFLNAVSETWTYLDTPRKQIEILQNLALPRIYFPTFEGSTDTLSVTRFISSSLLGLPPRANLEGE